MPQFKTTCWKWQQNRSVFSCVHPVCVSLTHTHTHTHTHTQCCSLFAQGSTWVIGTFKELDPGFSQALLFSFFQCHSQIFTSDAVFLYEETQLVLMWRSVPRVAFLLAQQRLAPPDCSVLSHKSSRKYSTLASSWRTLDVVEKELVNLYFHLFSPLLLLKVWTNNETAKKERQLARRRPHRWPLKIQHLDR